MKEKSIWYQGGKALLVLLFAAMMAILFFSCQSKSSQIAEMPKLNSVNFYSAIEWNGKDIEKNGIEYNKLYVWNKDDGSRSFFYVFDQTPYGIKSALTKLELILSTNGVDMMYPDEDNSFKGKDVEYITDYVNMNESLISGNSYINFVYLLDELYVDFDLNQRTYVIILKEYE